MRESGRVYSASLSCSFLRSVIESAPGTVHSGASGSGESTPRERTGGALRAASSACRHSRRTAPSAEAGIMQPGSSAIFARVQVNGVPPVFNSFSRIDASSAARVRAVSTIAPVAVYECPSGSET